MKSISAYNSNKTPEQLQTISLNVNQLFLPKRYRKKCGCSSSMVAFFLSLFFVCAEQQTKLFGVLMSLSIHRCCHSLRISMGAIYSTHKCKWYRFRRRRTIDSIPFRRRHSRANNKTLFLAVKLICKFFVLRRKKFQSLAMIDSANA